MRNVDEEAIFESFATDKDGKIIAAAVGQGEIDANMLAGGSHGKLDTVAHANTAGRITNTLDTKIFDCQTFPGIERAFWAKKTEFELFFGGDDNVAGPD